jgi:hypothetical protein
MERTTKSERWEQGTPDESSGRWPFLTSTPITGVANIAVANPIKHKHFFKVPAMLKSLFLLLEYFSLNSLSLSRL